MKNKTDLRIYAKEYRKSLDIQSISQKMVNLIRQVDIYTHAQNVMIYYPVNYEINLLELTQDNKNFFLPKMDDKSLLVCPFGSNLEKSKYNIMEPCSKPIDPDILDLIIVPALMADKLGYRLGYGGGFYDRFLKNCNAQTIAAVPKELFVEKLPTDEFDVKIDLIIYT